MQHLLLSSLFLLISLPSKAVSNDNRRIDQLEREVSQLRQQITHLRDQINRLGGTTTASHSTHSNSHFSSYIICKGDTLWSIARQQGTSIPHLESLNPSLNPRRMPIGQTIRIPSHSSSSSQRQVASSSSRSSEKYTIKEGDTLGEIAGRLRIRLTELTRANPGIDPRRLGIGKRINIPDRAHPKAPVISEKQTTPALQATEPTIPPRISTPASSPESPQLIVVSENRRLDEIARFYHTDVATINKLNQVILSPAQIIKNGSEIYVPKQ